METIVCALLLVLAIAICLLLRDYLAFRELEALRIHERVMAGFHARNSKPLTGYDAARLAKQLGWTNIEHTDTWALGCPPGSEKRELVPLHAQQLLNLTREPRPATQSHYLAPPCP